MTRFKHLTLVFVAFLLIVTSAWGADVSIIGLDLGKWKHTNWRKFATGAVVSSVVHELGHLVALEVFGVGYDFKWWTPEFRWGDARGHGREVSTAGFVAQHGFNAMLVKFKKGSDFTKGYTVSTALLQFSYPLRHRGEGDLWNMGKDKDRAWWIFNGICLRNILEVRW